MSERQHYFLSLIGTLLLMLLSIRPAGAHGSQDTAVVEEAIVGPYRLTAWLSPAVTRTHAVHFSALVALDGTPVLDCDVSIDMIPVDHNGPALSAIARPVGAAGHSLHEIELNQAYNGSYEGRITVRDLAGNGGQAMFQTSIGQSAAWIVPLIYGQLVSAPVIGFWLLMKAIGAWVPSGTSIKKTSS